MATRLDRPYEEDLHAWTCDQAKALRRLAQVRPNDAIDFAHLVEEVRGLGKSERDAVRGHVRTIVEHLLKLERSATREARAGWIISIAHARVALQDKLTRSLRRDLTANLDRLYAQARHQALVALRVYGESEAIAALPVERPYTLLTLADSRRRLPTGPIRAQVTSTNAARKQISVSRTDRRACCFRFPKGENLEYPHKPIELCDV